MADLAPYWQNCINGEWVDGGAGRIPVHNPGTAEALAEQALADSADVDRAMTAARRMRAGRVFVNEWYAGGVETPFGGYGHEKGREALWKYVQTKNIAIKLGKTS